MYLLVCYVWISDQSQTNTDVDTFFVFITEEQMTWQFDDIYDWVTDIE